MGIGRNTVCSFSVRTSVEQRTLHPCCPEPHAGYHVPSPSCLSCPFGGPFLRLVGHVGYSQLAKLIVNSGGAAALVDYVADAQVSNNYQFCNFRC